MFSKNLKYLRKKNGMEQLDLAKRLGRKSASSISEWERGTYTPKAGILADISKVFGISLDRLMNEDLEGASDISEISENNDKLNSTDNIRIKYYNFFDTGLSAGILSEVDPFSKSDTKKIPIPDSITGKYTNDNSIFFTYINGESMNRILPNRSLIGVKNYDSIQDLKDGDIVVFQEEGDMCIKQFYNDYKSKIYSFMPNSTDSTFKPINYRWENAAEIDIIGKVVIYVVVM